MPRRKIYDLAHYSKSGVVTESRKSAEVDQIWGDRQPFHGDDKPWDVRVDTVLTECAPPLPLLLLTRCAADRVK